MGRHTFVAECKKEKLQEYIDMHNKIYPEVVAGLRKVGVTSLRIYLVPGTSTLFMSIVTAGNLDFVKAVGVGSQYRAEPRIKEWEEMMATDYHSGWTELKEIHSSEKHWNGALGLPSRDDAAAKQK